MKMLWIRALSVLLLALIFWTPDSAESATPLLTQYRHTSWSDVDGTPINARSLAQTRDGYLWVGTSNGLLRFDGTRFASIGAWAGTALPSPSIRAIFGSSDGSLWASTQGHIMRLSQDRLEDHPIAGGVNAIVDDGSGGVWFAQSRITGNQGALCRVAEGAVRCFGPSEITLPRAVAINIASDGAMWFGRDTGLCRWTLDHPAECYLHELLGPTYGLSGIQAILQTRRGEQWSGIHKAGHPYGLGHLVDGTWVPYVTPDFDGAAIDVISLVEDADEALWIGTYDQGIYRLDHGRVEHFNRADGLTDDAISEMMMDRDGTVWAATARGLESFQRMPVTVFSRREGLPANAVSSVVAARDGHIWIGNQPLSGLLNGLPVENSFKERLRGKRTTSLLEDRKGRLWVGMENELFVLDGDTIHSITSRDGNPPGAIKELVDDLEGGVWAVTVGPRRLLHISGYRFDELIADPDLTSVALNPQGALWLGYQSGAVGRFDNRNREASPTTPMAGAGANIGTSSASHDVRRNAHAIWPDRTSNRDPSGALSSIKTEVDGTIFGMTSQGLLMMRGETHRILGMSNGLPCAGTSDAIRDADGALWLLLTCGLARIAASDLEDWYAKPTSQVSYRLISPADGFRAGISGFSPKSSLAPDGRLWFASDKNVQVIDPRQLNRLQAPPSVKIEEIAADRVSHEGTATLQFPPRTRDIEIHYTALSFVLPGKVRFKYRLEGRDKGWTDAATRRVAYYTDLDPGVYRFQVVACNSDGVWNETGAAIGFEVQPSFYRTRWFMIVCVVLSLALLYFAYALRLRQLAANYREHLATKIAERERIARELHDTLLQSTEGLVLIVQAASSQLSKTDPVRGAIDRALFHASSLVAEGRDRVQQLRGVGVQQIDLVEQLATLGESLSLAHGAAFTLTVEGHVERIESSTLDEVFLILREGMSNAFTHASAESVELSLRTSADGLRATIRDNGRGLDIEALESGRFHGHWGIKGMQERALHIDAVLDIRSRVGGGTEIELFAPMRSPSTKVRRWLGLAHGPLPS